MMITSKSVHGTGSNLVLQANGLENSARPLFSLDLERRVSERARRAERRSAMETPEGMLERGSESEAGRAMTREEERKRKKASRVEEGILSWQV